MSNIQKEITDLVDQLHLFQWDEYTPHCRDDPCFCSCIALAVALCEDSLDIFQLFRLVHPEITQCNVISARFVVTIRWRTKCAFHWLIMVPDLTIPTRFYPHGPSRGDTRSVCHDHGLDDTVPVYLVFIRLHVTPLRMRTTDRYSRFRIDTQNACRLLEPKHVEGSHPVVDMESGWFLGESIQCRNITRLLPNERIIIRVFLPQYKLESSNPRPRNIDH